MSSIRSNPLPEPKQTASQGRVINDFTIQIATTNGSGSQSSNNILMRSIFQMGIPISGKNLFPSNIQGLPTWFTIRVSKKGYVGPKKANDLLIAMNPQTAHQDVMDMPAGGAVIYEEKLKLSSLRDDLVFYPVPFQKLAVEVVDVAKLRRLVVNMVYVGSAAELLGIGMEQVEKAISMWFKGKPKAVEINVKAARRGAEYVRDHLQKSDPYWLEPMEETQGKIIIDGNAACALGALFGGVTVVTWYPITPSSSVCESLIEYLNKYRVDPESGRASFAVVQAEDELAAAGMIMGAGWAGARAMTSTSGPGISLMSEFVGLGYFAEVPCVIFDIQRVGPSTGLPTRTSQGDVQFLHGLSHGDTLHPVLFPASPGECFEFAYRSFDVAERVQSPVFVASDLDLGMNNWMADAFEYPQDAFDRGKVLDAEQLTQAGEFARYRDVDGDGIPYRTLPGTDHPLASYFTRGSGHDENADYTERPEEYVALMDRLARKMKRARQYLPAPVIDEPAGAQVGIIAYGSTDVAMDECRDQLREEHGIETAYYRIRALPLLDDIEEFVRRYPRSYVVEQNRDGQMCDVVRLQIGKQQSRLHQVLRYDGLPIDARSVSDEIRDQERGDR